MSGPRTRFVSHSRDRAISVVEARRAWSLIVGMARDQAARVAAGAVVHQDETRALLGALVQLKAAFPVPYASAANMAEAFLILARGFCAAGLREDRETAAGFLAAGAHALDRLLTQHGHALAAASRRWAGDTD